MQQVHILFDHSNPFLLAHGGLQIQIEQTRAALLEAGAHVDYLRWWDPGQTADLIHFFGRPHPSYIEQAHEKGLPVVFSELLGGTGSRSAPALAAQRIFIRIARGLLPDTLTARMAWTSYSKADAVVALTAWEQELMRDLFSAPDGRVHVVPNGVEPVFFEEPHPPTSRARHLICTATITERKRVLELAEAAVLAGVPVRFYGKPYSLEHPYFRRFEERVRSSGGLLEYGGGIPDRLQLAREYRGAAGFVLLSAMESQSLSALEAAACGCPLLLSDLPWARSSFGGHASYVPLESPAVTAGHLRLFFNAVETAPRPPRVLSWRDVAGQLLDIYSEAVTARRARGGVS